jgi:hypothetical protein
MFHIAPSMLLAAYELAQKAFHAYHAAKFIKEVAVEVDERFEIRDKILDQIEERFGAQIEELSKAIDDKYGERLERGGQYLAEKLEKYFP